MTAAQSRLADTIDVFYGAADKSSDSAMAAHAYKRSVDDLETGVSRELVRYHRAGPLSVTEACGAGYTISRDYHGATWQNECILPSRQ